VLDNEVLFLEHYGEILKGYYKVETIDLESATLAVESRLEFQKGVLYKILCDASSLKNITPEARKYLSSPISHKGVKAAAFIIKSPIGAVLGNFYLKFGGFPVPTKLFRNEQQAMDWLNSLG
jgi:hypothetical protein